MCSKYNWSWKSLENSFYIANDRDNAHSQATTNVVLGKTLANRWKMLCISGRCQQIINHISHATIIIIYLLMFSPIYQHLLFKYVDYSTIPFWLAKYFSGMVLSVGGAHFSWASRVSLSLVLRFIISCRGWIKKNFI